MGPIAKWDSAVNGSWAGLTSAGVWDSIVGITAFRGSKLAIKIPAPLSQSRESGHRMTWSAFVGSAGVNNRQLVVII